MLEFPHVIKETYLITMENKRRIQKDKCRLKRLYILIVM